MPIRVPPMREHLEDIETLATHFLAKCCAENGLAELRFSPEALAAMKQHDWPGNVRELRNVVQRCAVSAEPPWIGPEVIREQLENSL